MAPDHFRLVHVTGSMFVYVCVYVCMACACKLRVSAIWAK